MSILILLRHGESTFNAEGRFTGTTDVPLTDLGREQAAEAGELLAPLSIHSAFSSERIRAIETFNIVRESLHSCPEATVDHRLNEQDFGDLEGVNKEEANRLFGADQVLEWRRAFNGHPPRGERFLAVQTRVAHFFEDEVEAKLKEGKNVLVVAHGNSLRALAINLLKLELSEIATFELANAVPFALRYEAAGQKFVRIS